MYDALPRAAQDFLRLSEVELDWMARVPDEIAGDNIAVFGGCSEVEAFAHSYKLEREPDGSFRHLTGSAPTVISQAPRLCRDAVREGQFDEARRHMAMAFSHYAVDSCTIWHLSRELTSEEHRTGEATTAKNLRLLTHPGPLPMPDPKSLYRSAIKVCEDTVTQQLDRVKQAQADGSYAKAQDLMAEQLNRCASWGLAVALYTWHFVERA